MPATIKTLLGLDQRLVRGGHLPLPEWWVEELTRFYTHPTAMTFVGRVGRGGAKSHVSAKVSLNEVLFGDWVVPPGERHFWAYVSRTKDEAGQRLLLIESFLKALGVKYIKAGDEIALADAPRGWRVFAATVGAVSGFRCFGYSADELAKWTSGDTFANPSEEVCASLSAMAITHARARRLLISSPQTKSDYHAIRFERGDADDQVVAHAPSWVANPDGVTEEGARLAASTDHEFRREYAAEVQDAVLPAFTTGIAACIVHGVTVRSPVPDAHYGLAYDAAQRHDNFAALVYHLEHSSRESGPPLEVLVLDAMLLLKPSMFGLKKVSLEDAEEKIARLAKAYGVTELRSDLHLADALAPRFKLRGLRHVEVSMAVAEQERRSSALIGRVTSGALALLDNPDLIKEFREAELRLSGGRWILSAPSRRSAHDDLLDCCLIAAEHCSSVRVAGDKTGKTRKLQVSGSGDVFSERSVSGHFSRQHGFTGFERRWYRHGPNGEKLRTGPPHGTPEYEQARAERNRRGDFTPQDLIDRGESPEEVRRMFGINTTVK